MEDGAQELVIGRRICAEYMTFVDEYAIMKPIVLYANLKNKNKINYSTL